jgi:calcium-dependent protein kinase
MQEVVGSALFVAPEVLNRSYGKECDIWSCGVILYVLLTGEYPFQGSSSNKIFKKILTEPVDLSSSPWIDISREAKDCVRRMLCKDPKKRLTAEELLQVVVHVKQETQQQLYTYPKHHPNL